jgi:hypothetical protein
MKLHITIGRDGLLESRSLVSNRSTTVYTSIRARAEIYRQLHGMGTICGRCTLICRSDEIVNGVCADGVGCSADVDILEFYQSPEEPGVHMMAEEVPYAIWRSFVESVIRQEWLNSLPPHDEEGNDVRW